MNDIAAIGTKPIRQPDEKSLSEALRLTLLVFVFATPFFAFMGVSANQVKEEYNLSKLVERRRALLKDRDRLTLTRDALLAPDAVTRTAREKLGMEDEDSREWTMGVAPEKDAPGAKQAKKEKPPTAGAVGPEKSAGKPAKNAPAKSPAAKTNAGPPLKPPEVLASPEPIPAAPAPTPTPPPVKAAAPPEKPLGASMTGVPLDKPPGGPSPKHSGKATGGGKP